jgi:hypothetical protein
MRKFYFLILISLIGYSAKAQVNVLCEDFTTYDSLTSNGGFYNGWYFSYHSNYSYYTSTQSAGPSGPHSYKFGADSATAYTPNINNATYIHFWMKGNAPTSGNMAQSTFYVYQSPDSLNWTSVHTYSPPISTVGAMQQWQLAAGTQYVKFFYDKDSGNVAFDDFCATIGPTATRNPDGNDFILNVFPSPSRGVVNLVCSPALNHNAEITIVDMIGVTVRNATVSRLTPDRFSIDLKGKQPGVYFAKIKTDKGIFTKRFTLNP